MQRALAAEEDRRARRLARREERHERRAARRGGRRRKPRSGVGLLIGAAALTVVVVDGAPFWLLFIAAWMVFEGLRRLIGRRASAVEAEQNWPAFKARNCQRVLTFSSRSNLETWFRTVKAEMFRIRPICLFVYPNNTWCSTSSCRAVRST